jgi:hypothetical protein
MQNNENSASAANAIVSALLQKGLILISEGGRLRVFGSLTDEDRRLIRNRKSEILRALSGSAASCWYKIPGTSGIVHWVNLECQPDWFTCPKAPRNAVIH